LSAVSRAIAVDAFHSTISKSMSMPTSFRFSCTNSFTSRGFIWPEPKG